LERTLSNEYVGNVILSIYNRLRGRTDVTPIVPISVVDLIVPLEIMAMLLGWEKADLPHLIEEGKIEPMCVRELGSKTCLAYLFKIPYTSPIFLGGAPHRLGGESGAIPLVFVPFNVKEITGRALLGREVPFLTVVPIDFTSNNKPFRSAVDIVDTFFRRYPDLLDILHSLGTAWEVAEKNPITVLLPYQNIPNTSMEELVEALYRSIVEPCRLYIEYAELGRRDLFHILKKIGKTLIQDLERGKLRSVEPEGGEIYIDLSSSENEGETYTLRSVVEDILNNMAYRYG